MSWEMLIDDPATRFLLAFGLIVLVIGVLGLVGVTLEEYLTNYKYYHVSAKVRAKRAKIKAFWEKLGRK